MTISEDTALHVIFPDNDQAVSRNFSEDIYRLVPSASKQSIDIRSYPELEASHFWPLTKKFNIFGGPVAAAWDLESAPRFSIPYLYGKKASDKGVEGLRESIRQDRD